jgi:glutamate 5-kinase
MELNNIKRLVVKVGSSILIDENEGLRRQWLAALVQDIVALEKEGTRVIVVTSGAVALGRTALGIEARPLKLEEKQAAAACGQIALVQAWRESLMRHKQTCAQLLLTIDDSENRRRYLNARNTLETLLDHGVIPVINENDTVATAELRFGDNDRLAARVAQMASADALVLLSDIDGLYDSNPHSNRDAKFISKVEAVTPEIESYAGGATSAVGSGGMITKIEAAKIALAAGCHMIIAPGHALHPLKTYAETKRGTWFVASSTPISARKHWISGSIAPQGVIIVDDGAAAALKGSKSLLPAGVVKAEGHFGRGDAVIIKDGKGVEIGKGLIAYSSEDTLRILGHKSQDIEKILGFKGRAALIHRDDMVLRQSN